MTNPLRLIPALLPVVFAIHAAAATVEIQPGTARHTALRNAILAANPGDVVILKAGVHEFPGEALIANKTGITVRGEAGAIIRKLNGTANIPAINLQPSVSGFTFANFEIDGTGQADSGIICYGDNNTFEDLNVHHCGRAGILFHEADGNVVSGGTYLNNNNVGLSQFNCRNARFTNVTANANGEEGITIDLGTDDCTVTSSTFNNNSRGLGGVGSVGIDDADRATLTGCTISNNTKRSGVTFQNNVGPCDGCKVTNSTIQNNTGYGVRLRTDQFPVTNLTLSGNTYGGNRDGDTNYVPPTPPSTPPPTPPTTPPPSSGGGGGGGGASSLWFITALSALALLRARSRTAGAARPPH